ncbi:MAG: glycoside hydrolase family protein [Muribaculaceae bacterium]
MKNLRNLTASLFIALTAIVWGQKQFVAQPIEAEVVLHGKSQVLRGESVFALDDHFVWGASAIQADNGLYYMVFSAPESGRVFTEAWVTGSKMGIAVSDKPDRDYRMLGFFMNSDGYRHDTSSWDSQSVQNPHLRKFGDKYYLYYVGTSDPGNDKVKSATDTLDRRSRLQQVQKIGVIEFDSFEQLLRGEYRGGECILEARTRVKNTDIVAPSPEGTKPLPDNIIVVNPSVVQRLSDGKYLLYFKGNIYDPSWRGIHGVAIADSPMGPFVPQDFEVFTIDTPDGAKLSAEDPYVWYSEHDNMFYAVFKDFTGHFTKAGPSLAWMQSTDGIHWTLPDNPLFIKKQVVLKSGETVPLDRLERPQILHDADGRVKVLFAACTVVNVNPRTDGCSMNVQIPISEVNNK